MAGNKTGGKKTAAKNLAKDPDYYRNLGRKGGRKGTTGGFASNKVGKDGLTGSQRASIVGAKGGAISRRGPSKQSTVTTHYRRKAEPVGSMTKINRWLGFKPSN